MAELRNLQDFSYQYNIYIEAKVYEAMFAIENSHSQKQS